MKRTTLAFAFTGLALGGGTTLLFAGDPPPPPPAASTTEAAEISQRVEDLGSADFRVREAAWKALVGYGAKARPALEAAVKSDNPSVRFRAEQLLARLSGGSQERPLDDGTPPGPAPGGSGRPGAGNTPAGPGRFFTDEDFERLMRETQERMKKMQEELRREFGGGPGFGPDVFGGGGQGGSGLGGRWRVLPGLDFNGRREIRVAVEGGTLRESFRGARIELIDTAPNGTTMSTVYEGRTLDAIFEARPGLRDEPKVKALLEKKAAEEAARAEREKGATPGQPPRGGSMSTGKTVMVTSQDGHTTVTVTETAPDGKQTTKTYEGADLESIKRDHPELADSLGGFRIQVGPGGGQGLRPMDPIPDDDLLGPDPAATGPFGLGLVPVDEALRTQLALEAGKGAVIVAVRPGSDADKLGLRAHDVITAVNGTAVTGAEQIAGLVQAAKDGPLTFDVLRGGKALTLKR